jgi:tRNA (cmo5U34)-methyltransferase
VSEGVPGKEWSTAEHAGRYLARADAFPHRSEGEAVLLDHVPRGARRILDLGTGDGRLLALLRGDRPDFLGVGVDVSEPMLAAAASRFAGARGIAHTAPAPGVPGGDRRDPRGGGPVRRLLDVETQLVWLREHGFEDVDCHWKWLEMALLVGVKPG